MKRGVHDLANSAQDCPYNGPNYYLEDAIVKGLLALGFYLLALVGVGQWVWKKARRRDSRGWENSGIDRLPAGMTQLAEESVEADGMSGGEAGD